MASVLAARRSSGRLGAVVGTTPVPSGTHRTVRVASASLGAGGRLAKASKGRDETLRVVGAREPRFCCEHPRAEAYRSRRQLLLGESNAFQCAGPVSKGVALTVRARVESKTHGKSEKRKNVVRVPVTARLQKTIAYAQISAGRPGRHRSLSHIYLGLAAGGRSISEARPQNMQCIGHSLPQDLPRPCGHPLPAS